MDDPVYRDILADIANMYYFQEMTQNAIGQALGLSRIKVYRLLKEARDSGVVEITIHRSRPRNDQLEQELKERFGLKDALVLATGGLGENGIWRGVGEIAARYLERLLKDNSTIAICLGRSTYEVVQAVRSNLRANVRIAQALGSIPFAIQELDSSTLARQLAQKLGGEVLYLPSPMIADSPEAAGVLRRQRDIERTLAAAAEADLALVGIGNLDPTQSRLVHAANLTPEQLAALIAQGAVGDIAGQIFTADGSLSGNGLTERIIGLTLDELKRIPTVIAVAFGQAKTAAILGALRTGAVDVLCTDDSTASEVLRMAGPAAQKGGA
jgi:DNA-binding transcriptional regulator LsrR (DeoR family)